MTPPQHPMAGPSTETESIRPTRAHPDTSASTGYGYESTQELPTLNTRPALTGTYTILPPKGRGTPPIPHPWTPKYIPENWVYIDGSDIDGHPRLGAAVIHIPTATTIYIDAAGTEETRTIMRAELVAIHTALSTFAEHEWLGIFTDSLSSLQAILHHNTHPGIRSARDYHHHVTLLYSITALLETRKEAGHHTTLHKIRAHTNVRGNDLADAAAKLAVTSFESLPPQQSMRVDIREIAPRPHHWVM